MKQKICFAGFFGAELEALQTAVAQAGSVWECAFCSDGETALQALSFEPYDAVVANMRMKGINGAELLHTAASSHPHACRIVVGNLADQELVVNCIGETHQFISPPWKAADIIALISRSLALDSWISNDALRAFVPRLGKLPGLPATYFEVLKKVESPTVTVEAVGEVIARDPALTARLLQMVNSPACGLSQKVTNPMEAVSMLGLDAVKSLVLCLQIFDRTTSQPACGLSMDALWRQSFRVGNLAGKIALAQTHDARLAGDCFTAGLLHKIGQIVVAANLGTEYGAIVTAAREKKRPLAEEEEARWGLTSAQVGGYLLGVWGLPLALVEAVGLHDQPKLAQTREFSVLTAVHIASALAGEEKQCADDLLRTQLDTAYLNTLKVPAKLNTWRKILAHEEIAQDAPPPRAEEPRIAKEPAGRRPPVGIVLLAAVVVAAIGVFFVMGRHASARSDRAAPASADSGDPQAPAPSAAAVPVHNSALDSIKVQGIIYQGNRSLVMVNGKTLAQGEHIGDAEIVSIAPSSVTISAGGEQRVFTMK